MKETVKSINLEKEVSNILKSLSVPCNLLGYDYLKEAIICVYKDKSYIHNVTKGLYCNIAERYKTTGIRVERAIRHAIEKSFSYNSMNKIDEVFGSTYSQCVSKPTNSEYIATIAEYLKFNYNEEK